MDHSIPDGARQQAVTTLHSMLERGLKNPTSITSTCKSIATIVLAKLDMCDRIMVRKLTNALVMYAWDHVSEEKDK